MPILGLGGFVYLSYMFDSINDTIEADPTATSWDGFKNFYENMTEAVVSGDSISGIGYALTDLFNVAVGLTADFALPGAGAAIHSIEAADLFGPQIL